MIRPVVTLRRRRIIIDVDTQKDFLLASGSACVRNHRRVLQNIRRVMAWARVKNVRVISTKQVYEPGNNGNGNGNGDGNGNGNGDGHAYCVRGTEGCRKVPYTVRKNHVTFAADGCTDLPRDILKTYDQVVLHKRCVNPFDEPRADRILGELQVNEFVVIGARMEDAVKHTVLGLLMRRKPVTVLVDAVGAYDRGAAEIALRQMEAKGAKLAETKTLLGSSCLRVVGACECDRCQGRLQKKSFGVGA